ncbi:hypothetical protein AB1Y20_018351 [Prymnesium parvum]|uniref:Protein kinase domain-containing protein n=1 Tax=Prymnesium parvum TaxID=97485 RepID=A0AB34JRR0_PRYPA
MLPPTPWGTPVALLGRGGLAEVYLLPGPPPTAVKLMRKPHLAFLRAAPSVAHELAALRAAAAGCPASVVRLLAAAHDGKAVYLRLSASLPSTPLDALLAANPRGVPPAAAARLAAGLAGGLAHLHAAAVAHRDVAPPNVSVSGGQAVLLDLGCAKLLGEGGSSGTWCGRVAYMAPERRARRPHGVAADCWSLGVVAVEALTGEASGGEEEEAAAVRRVAAAAGEAAADLVARLLRADATARMSAAEAAAHEWCGGGEAAALARLADALQLRGESGGEAEAGGEEDEEAAWEAAEQEEVRRRAEAAWPKLREACEAIFVGAIGPALEDVL